MRVKRIRVVIEIENDDGTVSIHETEGAPMPGTVEAHIVPHYQTRIHRRAGYVEPQSVVDVRVSLNATLDHPMFRVTEGLPAERSLEGMPEAEVYRIIER
jgi:hypothetical protein